MFLINLTIAGWVKFYDFVAPGVCITVICFITLLLWVSIYLKWGVYLSAKAENVVRKHENGEQGDELVDVV